MAIIMPEERKNIEQVNEQFSNEGLRVLAFACRRVDSTAVSLADENGLNFLGLIAMMDPPREESKAAVAECIRAGIRPIMITGDHKITAAAIAREIGILRDGTEAVEGAVIDKMSDEELQDFVPQVSVYARVSPEHKIRIVRAWQQRGNLVAMTGDGVNDAPALKQADIGVAMGITGTEVAKDAAGMVLADDNFATIVKAVKNGRNVYANIKRAVQFLLSGNTAGILTVLYAPLMGLPVPFSAVHLLFINLLTDSLPAIALGLEPHTDEVMREKPRPRNEDIFLHHEFCKGILCVSNHKFFNWHIAKDAKVLQIQPVERQRSKPLLHVHVSTQNIIAFSWNSCVQLIQQFLKWRDVKVQNFRQHRSIRLRLRSVLHPISHSRNTFSRKTTAHPSTRTRSAST